VPIPGTRKRSRLEENLGAGEISLSAEELQAIEAAVHPDSVQGTRYGERELKMVNL
jgi:aryl-alcohol dehydrogenase-like predicted oxidoreductase